MEMTMGANPEALRTVFGRCGVASPHKTTECAKGTALRNVTTIADHVHPRFASLVMTMPTPRPLSCVGTARCAVQARWELPPDHLCALPPSAFHAVTLWMCLVTGPPAFRRRLALGPRPEIPGRTGRASWVRRSVTSSGSGKASTVGPVGRGTAGEMGPGLTDVPPTGSIGIGFSLGLGSSRLRRHRRRIYPPPAAGHGRAIFRNQRSPWRRTLVPVSWSGGPKRRSGSRPWE